MLKKVVGTKKTVHFLSEIYKKEGTPSYADRVVKVHKYSVPLEKVPAYFPPNEGWVEFKVYAKGSSKGIEPLLGYLAGIGVPVTLIIKKVAL